MKKLSLFSVTTIFIISLGASSCVKHNQESQTKSEFAKLPLLKAFNVPQDEIDHNNKKIAKWKSINTLKGSIIKINKKISLSKHGEEFLSSVKFLNGKIVKRDQKSAIIIKEGLFTERAEKTEPKGEEYSCILGGFDDLEKGDLFVIEDISYQKNQSVITFIDNTKHNTYFNLCTVRGVNYLKSNKLGKPSGLIFAEELIKTFGDYITIFQSEKK